MSKCSLSPALLWQGHVYSCYSAMIQKDKSSMHSTAEVASSGVSAAARVGSPDASSVNPNNAAGTASPATPDNKRRRLRAPQRQ
jgi:cyclin D5, plant